MNKALISGIAALLASSAGPAMAGDAAAGRAKAAICVACHGVDGVGLQPLYPNLAGQKEAYLIKQLQAFKNGQRKDPLMSPMAMPLSQADIENVSAYYSSLRPNK